MMTSHNHQGYSCYCFRCGFKDFQGKGYQTLEQLAQIKAQDELAQESMKTLELPKDINYNEAEWPTEARLWLYKAGIYGPTIHSNGIGYSKFSNRVLLPTFTDGTLRYFQARRLQGTGPKYINPRVDKTSLLHLCRPDDSGTKTIVVVEDVLSAIRVGSNVPCAALLGTKLSTGQANQLAEYDTIISWFDNDRAGKDCALAVRRTMSLTNDVYDIQTDVDPKEHSSKQIQSILKEHL